MKKLRSGLSLVLVLAMVLSLLTVGFAWETEKITYNDQDTISEYAEEAVATMSGMGIINGTDGGNFDPTGSFTREMAAKIVTYMKLQPSVAEKQPAKQVFSDVPADRWSAKYVNYANAQKIVAGNGDNTYGPEDVLTREAWLKMCLVAIGYDPVKEGLQDVGDAWEENTINLALSTGLVNTDELEYDWNRECAVYYAWKAMQMPQQGAKDAYAVYDGDKVVATFDNVQDAAAFVQANRRVVYINEGPDVVIPIEIGSSNSLRLVVMGSLGQKVYHLSDNGDMDPFGVQTYIWDNGEDEDDPKYIEYSRNDEEPVAEFTVAAGGKDIKDALGSKKFEIVTQYVDGERLSNPEKSDYSDFATPNDVIGGQGTLTRFFTVGNPRYEEYKVVEIKTYAYELTEDDVIDADPKSETPAYIQLPIPFGGTDSTAYGTYQTDEFKPKDVVGYTVSYVYDPEEPEKTEYIVSVEKLVGVTGKVTAVSADPKDPYISVDGEKKYANETYTPSLTVGQEGVFYYDQYGNILYVGQVKAREIDGYAYVVQQQAAKAGSALDLIKGETTTETVSLARIIDMATGEMDIVRLATVANKKGEVFYADQNGAAISEASVVPINNTAVGKVLAYFLNEDGTYVFATIQGEGPAKTTTPVYTLADANDQSVNVTIQNGVAAIGNGDYATSNTGLVATKVALGENETPNGGADLTTVYAEVKSVNNYTGFANFPTYSAIAKAVVIYGPGKSVQAVQVLTAVDPEKTTTSHNYAYCQGKAETSTDGETWLFNDAENPGKPEGAYFVPKEAGVTGLAKGTIYDLTFDEDGNIESATPVADTAEQVTGIYAEKVQSYEAGVQITADKQFDLSKATVLDLRNPDAPAFGTPKFDGTKVYVQIVGQKVGNDYIADILVFTDAQ